MKEINLTLIKSRRKEMRIPQQEMAEALGFKHASTYCLYEKGTYKLDASHLPVICNKLKLRMTEIFFDPSFAKIANM